MGGGGGRGWWVMGRCGGLGWDDGSVGLGWVERMGAGGGGAVHGFEGRDAIEGAGGEAACVLGL